MKILPSTSDAKVCEKCFKKHNFSSKFQNFTVPEQPREIEHKCNICKIYLPSSVKLQEHLIEHSFKGCEDRGYSCYICSAVFTAPAGLQIHMPEHGTNSKPYDCNLCKSKFFFRAELENHLINHENGRIKTNKESSEYSIVNNNNNNTNGNDGEHHQIINKIIPKTEIHDDDEEYIEVEKLVDNGTINEVSQSQSDREKIK